MFNLSEFSDFALVIAPRDIGSVVVKPHSIELLFSLVKIIAIMPLYYKGKTENTWHSQRNSIELEHKKYAGKLILSYKNY